MATLPEPLTDQQCDCRGLGFMPLEVVRLVDSDLAALSTGDEFKAAVLLWARSWTQVPAASLPDDDRILARLAGYSLAEWLTLREMALKGWLKCSDGRLYHPLIADLASEAYAKRRSQKDRINSRWARVRAQRSAENEQRNYGGIADDVPRNEPTDTTVIQGTGTVEGTEPPLSPPLGDEQPILDLASEEPEPPSDPVQLAFDAWNELARRAGLSAAKDLTETRRRNIGRRLETHGPDGWAEALRAVETSAWCRGLRAGRDGRAFKADLDFLCQAKSFQRLIEGFYGSDAPAVEDEAPDVDEVARTWRYRLREWTKNHHWNAVDWGPRPGRDGCQAPPEILAEFAQGRAA